MKNYLKIIRLEEIDSEEIDSEETDEQNQIKSCVNQIACEFANSRIYNTLYIIHDLNHALRVLCA